MIMKKTKCDAIKLESNKNNFSVIKALVEKKFQSWVISGIHLNLKKILS